MRKKICIKRNLRNLTCISSQYVCSLYLTDLPPLSPSPLITRATPSSLPFLAECIGTRHAQLLHVSLPSHRYRFKEDLRCG